jgi:hypothetical protein
VRTAAPAQWAALLASGLPVVQDGGFTEVAPGSRTVVADILPFANTNFGFPEDKHSPCENSSHLSRHA